MTNEYGQQQGYSPVGHGGYQQSPSSSPSPSYSHTPTVVVVQQTGCMDIQAMHIVSIVCCVLSLFFTPLIELVPMIIYCVYRPDRHSSPATSGLLLADLIVTWVVFAIWAILDLMATIFSFGILVFLFLFLIPYGFVLFFLHKARKAQSVSHVVYQA